MARERDVHYLGGTDGVVHRLGRTIHSITKSELMVIEDQTARWG